MIRKLIKRFECVRPGSALIMTVVLTVLLAIVAVMFVAVARMDSAATINIADNKMLDSAAKSIMAILCGQLVNDTPMPGTTQEYYDYPDSNNAWLASNEPYVYDNNGTPSQPDDDKYKWRQISDVTGHIQSSSAAKQSFATQHVKVDPPGSREVIQDYPDIILNANNELDEGSKDDGESNNEYRGQLADADGDGIADSKWIEITDLRTSKGKKIYAAVRVIDNSGMVNIDAAYRFDANSNDANKIDGKSQMQINLNGLLKGSDSIDDLHNARCGSEPNTWSSYEQNVIWRYGLPNGNYRPFDISDELELRYRYCIDSKFISRFEGKSPATMKGAGTANFGHLYDASSSGTIHWGLDAWQVRITDPNFFVDKNTNADRRHLLTTLNVDRIIAPDGAKMTNINTADVNTLYDKIRQGILNADSGFADVNKVSAQIAINIKDYRDTDSDVNTISVDGVTYYGFERPCVYISELAFRSDPNDGNSYAVELYKPYSVDSDPNGWKLYNNSTELCTVNWSDANKSYHVILWLEPNVPLDVNSGASLQNMGEPTSLIFSSGDEISLTRRVESNDIVVDSVTVPTNWLVADDSNHSIQRDITLHKCIRRLWSTDIPSTLGSANTYFSPDPNVIQAHPKNAPFINIGEIGMIFRKGAYYKLGEPNTNIIGYEGINKTEPHVRLNLTDPCFQQIFKYLTVMQHPTDNAEKRVKGRININTAPASVIAQLPWVSLRKGTYNDPNLAKAIVAYRDKQNLSASGGDYRNRPDPCGFRSIGELCNVTKGSDPNFGIDYYSRDSIDQSGTGIPDLTPGEGAPDDFEERDLIFARISDLVTVRSDVFAAYILVRVCTNVNSSSEVEGPQKRYIAIIDRSQVDSPGDKPVIKVFQPVPEAR